jgi:hypothetical protein
MISFLEQFLEPFSFVLAHSILFQELTGHVCVYLTLTMKMKRRGIVELGVV